MVGGNMFETIKKLFRKAGVNMGMGKSLVIITDDERISIPATEYERIDKAFRYYRNDYDPLRYKVQGNPVNRPLHALNMTKTAARRLAGVVFNEKAKISFKDKTLNEFIQNVLEDNDFLNQFEMNLEKGIVAGGFAMRPYVADGKIKIAWVRANQFYPLRSNTNDISECAISSRTQRVENQETIYYTLLEFHQWKKDEAGKSLYVITNELYRSDNINQVGTQVPLARIYDDIEENVIVEGLTAPLFSYFRCPGANNISLESPLGVGIVDNAKDVLDDINLLNDKNWTEIKLSGKRVIVPQAWLKHDDTHKPYFDTFDESIQAFNIEDTKDYKIQDNTLPFRTVQMKDAMDHAIKKFENQIGISSGTLSYADDGLHTATEVVSNNSMTYQTRSSYLTMVEKAIKQLMIAIIELAGAGQFYDKGNPLLEYDLSERDLDFEIYFDDGVFVNKDKQLEDDLKVLMAHGMPLPEFLKRNYGLSDSEAKKWANAAQEVPPTSEQELSVNEDGD
ncbi:phage portal protein [Latilactobacillus sakei]